MDYLTIGLKWYQPAFIVSLYHPGPHTPLCYCYFTSLTDVVHVYRAHLIVTDFVLTKMHEKFAQKKVFISYRKVITAVNVVIAVNP